MLNQVMVTLQNYEHLLYWKWPKEKQFTNKYHFVLLRLINVKKKYPHRAFLFLLTSEITNAIISRLFISI